MDCNEILRVGTEQEQIIQLYKAVKELSKMGVYTIMAGVWNAETNYNKKQMLVEYNGASYIKRVDGDCVNESPELNPIKWQLIAAQGAQGAQGAPGEPGEGLDSLTGVNLTLGDTTVEYNTTDGIQMTSTGRFSYAESQKDAPVTFDIPIKAGNNISIDKAATGEYVEVKINEQIEIDEVDVPRGKNIFSVIFTDGKGGATLTRIPAMESGNTKELLHEGNVKTLFGNKSIYSADGTGNIDLYRHYIAVGGDIGVLQIEFISSNNLKVDSLTDLFSLYSGIHPASGYISEQLNYSIIYAAEFEASGDIYYYDTSNGELSMAWATFNATHVIDTVTTV